VDGEALHDLKLRQEERCFPVNRIVPWMAQLCDALDYALRHHQMVHGDINPMNLLITTDEGLRVADFGLARSLFDLKKPDGSPVLVGTLAFISPERAREAPVTVADDVYAFGATVFDAVTGRPPFFRGNVLWQLESVVAATMTERRTELGIGGEAVPPEWEEVVAACLAKKPGDRPQSIREVGERLGLLEPMPPADMVSAAVVLPRPAEYYIPQPGRKTEPAEIYPSSLPTAGMEPMTMAGISHSPATRAGEEPAGAGNPLAVDQLAETDRPAQLTENAQSSGGNQLEVPASQAPTDTAPWATPLTDRNDNPPVSRSVSTSETPRIEPEAVPSNSLEADGQKESGGGPEKESMVQAETPKSDIQEEIPQAPDTAAAPPSLEPVQIPVAPPPSVVAIPPMDPGLELTLPQYPTVGRVALPTPVQPSPAPESPSPPTPAEPAVASAPTTPAGSEGQGDSAPPPLPTPQPPATAAASVSTRTTRAIPVSQTPAQARPPQPASPPSTQRSPEETNGPGKSPAPTVPASSAARLAAPPEATSVPTAPPPKRRSHLWWIAVVVAVSVMALVAVMMAFRKENGAAGLTDAVPTPISTPIAPREASPQPIPATNGRAVALNQVAELAGKGKPREDLVLVGDLKVISAQPPTSPGTAPGAILRPADTSLSAGIRVVATFRVGAVLPKEGTMVRWTETDRALVRSVERGEDGQLNVQISQGNRP
jgi:serine/threonine protein kinase